ncbi:MAG: hypothetical protein J6P55_08145 [Bacteroidaceae bacterium]|nr:hypothetical protein [Bacteroidaceae bacterium]
MDNVTLNNITASCRKDLSALFIGSGLNQLNIIARYCSDSQIISQVEELTENYHCMLSFLANGGKDEERTLTQEKICKKALEILRVAHRDIRLQEEHTWYAKAFHELTNQYGLEPEEELLKRWGANPLPDEQLLIEDQIFSLIWTSPQWSQKDTAHWYEFISRQTDLVKMHFIGAVILSLWEYLDEEKLSLLFLYTDTESQRLNALTITALILLVEKYQKELQLYPELAKRYQSSIISKNVTVVMKEKLLMLQTLIAIKKEQEDMAGFSLNMPKEEMEKLMNKKMANIGHMVNKGLDINLGNRSELWYKCSFLRENISHWWIPFEKSSPVIEELLIGKDGKFNKQAYQILDLPSECDIDRYAMFSFMARTEYKSTFIEQMAQSLDMTGLLGDENVVPYVNHMKTTMQNLYRIFVHSPIRNEIENPFSWPQNFWENPLLTEHLTEDNIMELCTEMMEAQILDQPVAWLNKIAETSGTSLAMLKLKSNCLFRNQKYAEAIDPLTQMLFFQEEDEWALIVLQKCYEKLGKKDKQLEAALRLVEISPENVNYLTTAAIALIETEKYEEALKHLFHLDYMQTDNIVFKTCIETCALHLKKFDIAMRYNQAVLAHTEYKDRYIEYMTAGHLQFAMGNWKEALASYKEYKAQAEELNKKENRKINPEKEFLTSSKILKELGITPSDIRLMHDMIGF